MASWTDQAIFYHLYPLGVLGAPAENDLTAPVMHRLPGLAPWLRHARDLGATALYLGPLFESGSHGYDPISYTAVDRRLGTREDLAGLIESAHALGLRVIIDAVFNHSGRQGPEFRDLQANGEASPYRDWFAGIDFSQRSPYGDPFAYDAWNGHFNLVNWNLEHPAVSEHLFAAVRGWFAELKIDGLRLDAADAISFPFLQALASVCRAANPDCWLLGEVVHGDYRQWANPHTLDATTNYECFKGLYSSFNDHNLFEIAYSLNRQFGPDGIYRDLPLYAFADNHDVNRVASLLADRRHLAPLYTILLTMPGVPAIYYGSEWGLLGEKGNGEDWRLRPALTLPPDPGLITAPALPEQLRRLTALRHAQPALRHGVYRQAQVASEQLVFTREAGDDRVVVAVNAGATPAPLRCVLPWPPQTLVDALDAGAMATVDRQQLTGPDIPPFGSRVLVPHGESGSL